MPKGRPKSDTGLVNRFHFNFKRLKEAKSVSLLEIANTLKVPRQTVQYWSNRGMPNPKNRRRLAVYFNVKAEELIKEI